MKVQTTPRRWFTGDPRVLICGLCGCPCQAIPGGTPAMGLAAHRRVVHKLVSASEGEAGAGAGPGGVL